MLGIAILIGIVVGFHNLAKKRELNGYVWGGLSLVGWFGGQFIAGMILGMTNPSALYDTSQLYIWGFSGSGVGLIILYIILVQVANKKKAEIENNDLIDDDTYLR